MPYKSSRQRRFMHARHPGIAARWDAEERVRKAWVNPTYGTAGTRRALRAAATEVEESAFRRAKPRKVTTLRKPKVYDLGSVGKSIDSELPIVPAYSGRANFRSGTASVGKRMNSRGVSAGVAKPKKVQPPRNPARSTPGAGMGTSPTYPQVGSQSALSGKPPIHPSQVGKSAKSDLFGEAAGLQRVARVEGRRTSMAAGYTRGRGRRVGFKDRINYEIGRRSNIEAGGGRRLRDVVNEQHSLGREARTRMADYRRRGISKRARRYDPEDRRQRRLGAAAATLGAGGAGLTGWGGHGAYRSSRNLRAAGEHLRHLNEPGAEIRFQAKHQVTDKAKGTVKGRVAYNRVADAKETAAISALSAKKNRPLVIGARHAGKIGGGVALMGAGAALAHHGRSRGNRRWN